MKLANLFPRLMVITDTTQVPPELLLDRLEKLLSLAPPGSVSVQLRDRQLPVRDRLSLGLELGRRVRAHDQTFIVNDRLDLARLLDADGVHLPADGVPPARAREFLGPDAWLSAACHPTPDGQLSVPPSPCLDAILVSPVFAPRKGRPALGCEGLERVASVAGPRVLALGGVDSQNAARCLAQGASGVAVIGALKDADPRPLLVALGLI